MITVSICEDDAYFASKLKELLDKYGRLKEMRLSCPTFSNGEKLLASGQVPDIILMDIKLPGRDGMQIVQHLRNLGINSQVIFITAFQKYVFQAFDLDAVHYILKPITTEKLFPALDKALKRILPDHGKTFFAVNGSHASRIPFRDILYCEALDHRITLHTKTGPFQFFGTLDAVQNKLDNRFFRCHRSYLVNLDFVLEIKPGLAVITGGGKVPVSRRKQRDFLQRLLTFCREGLI